MQAPGVRSLRGLIAQVDSKNGWQLEEHLGEQTPANLQHSLARAAWNADSVASTSKAPPPVSRTIETPITSGATFGEQANRLWCRAAYIPEQASFANYFFHAPRCTSLQYIVLIAGLRWALEECLNKPGS